MGGFRVNGCGTKDYFTKMKYLGERLCPQCKKVTPFYLERAKQKISVLYIPTVTLKERYAIMCEKCGTGNFIDETQMHQIMAGAEENVEVKEQDNISSVTNDLPQEKDISTNQEKDAIVHICPKCGTSGTGKFCSRCGTRYEEIARNVVESIKYCPNCGEKMRGPFCDICGMRYKNSTDVKEDDINIIHSSDINKDDDTDIGGVISVEFSENGYEEKDTKWECELCGTKNDSSLNRCSLCGFERKNKEDINK